MFTGPFDSLDSGKTFTGQFDQLKTLCSLDRLTVWTLDNFKNFHFGQSGWRLSMSTSRTEGGQVKEEQQTTKQQPAATDHQAAAIEKPAAATDKQQQKAYGLL